MIPRPDFLVKEKEARQWTLTPQDRCDSCGAQAYVRVTGVTGSLDFCGHHYKVNEDSLFKFSFETIDERDKLIENRLQGDD
jgi:hypothetical protein